MKPTPFLWFEKGAEEAAKFYCSIFPNSRITSANPMTVAFVLDGQEFAALNGGPGHPFSDAVSFVVPCKDQREIDSYWEKLTAGGGQAGPCGWCKDKYGVSWQVVPERIGKLLEKPKAVEALMKMQKIDVARLTSAA